MGNYERGLREAGGEAPLLRNQLTQLFGPRAAEFVRKGQKIPKAMKKQYLRRAAGLEKIDAPKAVEMLQGQARHQQVDAVKAFKHSLSGAKRVKLP